jgi:hypothetical protein
VPPSGSLQELVDRVATLDANRLELKVSEIDADAILFFRDGRAPAHRPLRRGEPGRIRTYSKLFGRDVILAYRLLKIEISTHEYLLTHAAVDASGKAEALRLATITDNRLGNGHGHGRAPTRARRVVRSDSHLLRPLVDDLEVRTPEHLLARP